MKWLPREHGLTVSWMASLVLSILFAKSISPAGLFLFLLAIPAVSVYDPFLVALRLWKLGRYSLIGALNANLAPFQKILLSALIVAVFAEIWIDSLPLYALVFPVFPLLFLLLFMYKLPERNLATRVASILFITGQFVLFSSAFSGVVSNTEITDYIFFSLISAIIVVSVKIKIDSIILKNRAASISRNPVFPLILVSVLILYFAAGGDLREFAFLLPVVILSAVSYQVYHTESIRKVGILSSFWTVATIIALTVANFY